MSGVIGGLIAAALIVYVSRRAASAGTPGQLRFGWFIKALGWVLATSSIGLSYVMLFTDHHGQYVSLSMLIGFFSLSGVYTLIEGYGTNGTFDSAGISFRSFWSGRKRQRWSDLTEVKLSAVGWYVLTFADGTKIRLSTLLEGHGDVLQHVESVREEKP